MRGQGLPLGRAPASQPGRRTGSSSRNLPLGLGEHVEIQEPRSIQHLGLPGNGAERPWPTPVRRRAGFPGRRRPSALLVDNSQILEAGEAGAGIRLVDPARPPTFHGRALSSHSRSSQLATRGSSRGLHSLRLGGDFRRGRCRDPRPTGGDREGEPTHGEAGHLSLHRAPLFSRQWPIPRPRLLRSGTGGDLAEQVLQPFQARGFGDVPIEARFPRPLQVLG